MENLKKLRAKNDLFLLSKEEDNKNEDLFVDSVSSPREYLAENKSDPANRLPSILTWLLVLGQRRWKVIMIPILNQRMSVITVHSL